MAKIQDFPIKKFGSKLMIAGKSVNNLPDEYLSYSRNARIYDGGIGPRKGKQLLTNSTLGTNNKGAFTMGGNLYQIANSKIYQVDTITGVQTEKANLGYDAMTDSLVYDYEIQTWTSLGTQSNGYTYTKPVNKIKFVYSTQQIILYAPDDSVIDAINITNSSTGKYKANVKILNTTTNYQSLGTGTAVSDGYILQDGQFIYLFPSGVPVVANASARDALYPTPTGGERVYRQDVTAFDYYSGSWATQSLGMTGTINLASGYYVISTGAKALIASVGQSLQVFDGTSLTVPVTQPGSNSGFVEYCRGYSFLASGNVLYISAPITPTAPSNGYDFIGSNSQNITFDATIRGLKATLDGIYIFTDKQVHLLDANSLQNVAGSATFISRPLGQSQAPVNNLCIVASGDKIFYINTALQVQTINYIQYTSDSTIGELSARPVVGIKEFLNTLDLNQPDAFGFYNENDKTVQFHIRSLTSGYNDYVLTYDLINDTWNVDTQKNYNYVVKLGSTYYGFSDVNSSIYIDDTGYSDAGSAIEFHIRTNNLNQGTILKKKYRGFYTAGGIGNQTDLNYQVNIDGDQVFEDTVLGNTILPDVGEIGGSAIGDDPIGGDLRYLAKLNPFDRIAKEGRIYRNGTRIQIDVYSQSQIQDFIIDRMGVMGEYTGFRDVSSAW